jgi:hypothetical protein
MSAGCFQTSSGDLERRSPPFHVRESSDAGSSERWQGPAKKRLDAAFICPAAGCGRRVAILYGGGIFACRHCYRLAYASSREDVSDRAARRADRLRARLGWEPGILNGEGGKPKGMRWRTFERLAAEHDAFVGEWLGVMAARFGIKF